MAESGFSSEYYRELVYAHVDNVNLLYVALTRAAESLHVFIPQKGGRTVGGLLLQSIATDGDKALLGDFEGRCTIDRSGRTLRFRGVRRPRRAAVRNAPRPSTSFWRSTPRRSADLRLRLPSQRYFEDGGRGRALAPEPRHPDAQGLRAGRRRGRNPRGRAAACRPTARCPKPMPRPCGR